MEIHQVSWEENTCGIDSSDEMFWGQRQYRMGTITTSITIHTNSGVAAQTYTLLQ